MGKVVCGIDVGTSGTRALLVDRGGKLVAQATAAHGESHPKPGWSEQDPVEWWEATKVAVKEALEKAGMTGRDVAAVGLSGQMHGLTILDERNEVVRPAILWNDQRSVKECEEIEEALGAERLLEIACNPALAGFTAPKIVWVATHEKENRKRMAHILLPKDYVRLKLTGEYATDVADGSGMLLMDVRKRDYSDEILSVVGVTREMLPKMYESPDVTGAVTGQGAKATGLSEGTPVVGGAGDQAAAAIGNGIVRGGVVSATIGTSGVVFAATDELLVDIPRGRVHTFCHAVPGKWHIMGCVLAAGGSLQWVRNELAEAERVEAERRGVDVYEVLSEKALGVAAGSDGLIFLPYLTGERSPLNDPYARGAWVGLTVRHGKGHLVRSVVEGATFAMKDCLEVVKELGSEVKEIRLSGGGAKSPLWQQVQSAAYGQAVSLLEVSEGSGYGAALLAMPAGGFYRDVEETCEAVIRVAERFEPDAGVAAMYEKVYPLYRRAYVQLKEEFRALGEIARES